ncbi:nucleoside recognition domain-containing protein [Prosthecobacter sp.]|uniref:nucleoside recognition domain-containing protein n=1 Tax=Prosthecobacter sp. TaxID=1965333 RepID=UPI0037C58462
MLNYIWATLLFIGLLVAGLVGRVSGDASVIDAAMKGAEKAVMGIALPLAGMMMFWLGVLRLLEKAGVLEAVVRLLSPLLRRLFPDVPTGHPAMSAMVMNLSANMLGLSNNATPLGLKAMGHLQELNPHKQSASNAMITFLALNTGAFTLIPMTAMNFLNAAGVSHSFRVIVPTILATACASVAAVIAAKSFQRLPGFVAQPDEFISETQSTAVKPAGISPKAKFWLTLLGTLFIGVSALELGPPSWRQTVLDQTGLSTVLAKSAQRKAEAEKTLALKKEEAKAAAIAAAATQTKVEPPVWRRVMDGASGLAIPAILILAVSVAWARGVKVYEEFVDGAKEGFQVAVRIMPYLVAMLAVLAILRESGAFQLLEYLLAPLLNMLGFPVELLSLALMRPLSGSGAQGILNEILTRPDLSEMVKFTAGILYGSTETTFYVLTVYFGSVGIRRFRHALVAGLTADFIGMVAAVFFGRLLFAFT